MKHKSKHLAKELKKTKKSMESHFKKNIKEGMELDYFGRFLHEMELRISIMEDTIKKIEIGLEEQKDA